MFGRKIIFSGGMSNFVGADGQLQRNPRRDALNTKLRARGHEVFDPQISVETDGRAYDYKVDGPREQKARKDANVLVYQIGSQTFAGVTMEEVINDVRNGRKVILWLTGDHDERGRPVFAPLGFDIETITDPVAKAHVQQMLKQGNSMRTNLLDFLKDADNLRIIHGDDQAPVENALRQFGVKI